MKKLQVVCGIILENGKVYIAKRGKGVDEGVWEFPGGKIEQGETEKAAIIRELKEELQVDVHVHKKLTTIIDEREDICIYVHAYLCSIKKGKPQVSVHSEGKWISPLHLEQYGFSPADKPMFDKLIGYLNRRRKYAILFLILAGIVFLATFFPFLLEMVPISWATIFPWVQTATTLFLCIFWISYVLLVWHSYQKILYRKGARLLVILALVCSTCLGGSIYVSYYYQNLNQYDTISTEVDLLQYIPFQSTKLAVLDQESKLTLQEPLLRIDGATALYPVYASFVQAVYPQKAYDLYESEVSCNTTLEAFDNLLKKEADIIFVAQPSKQQQQNFNDAGETLVTVPIGKEAFVFFVNVNNPVEELTMQQIKDIYTGKVTNWKEVGGHDEEITAFQRPEGSGSQSALQRLMGDTPLMKPLEKNVASGMGDIVSRIAEYENRESAIGFSFRYYTQEMVANKEIKLVSIDGVYPTEETIQADTYPIVNTCYAMYLASNEQEQISSWMHWITGSQGQDLVRKTGYVPTV